MFISFGCIESSALTLRLHFVYLFRKKDLQKTIRLFSLIVTEKRQTTEHEEFHDDELPEEDDHSTGSRERIEHKVS